MTPFSERLAYSVRDSPPPIRIREDAPASLRKFILKLVREVDAIGIGLPDILYADPAFREPPPRYSLSPGLGWFLLLEKHLLSCEWFRVFDFLERFAAKNLYLILTDKPMALYFTRSINQYFCDNGIGWQLRGDTIIARGDDGFPEAVATAASRLQGTERPTAANHLQSALKAISERPKVNTAGAVAHATSAVECLLHDITGGAENGLSDYLRQFPKLFHPCLKKTLEGVYNYASDAGARHGKEGIEPSFDEAQFAVTTCAAACTLLTATHPKEDSL